jgi:hypothetical protein
MISRKYPDRRRQVLVAMQNKGILDEGSTVKEALVISLGWIEKSELVPDPPVRTYPTAKVDTPFSMSELLSRP